MSASTEPEVRQHPPSGRSTGASRGLCSVCLDSFPRAELQGPSGARLCAGCAARRDATAGGSDPGADPDGARESTESAVPAPGPAPAPAESGAIAAVEGACSGRCWWARAPILAWMAWILVRHLASPEYQSLFKPLNLGVHELGHFVFAPFGRFLEMAGGSILQCLAPLVALGMFFRQRDVFAMTVAVAWLGTNLIDVAVYAGDARSMALPLVRPGGGEAIHDWNWMLGRLGMLHLDGTIAFVLRAAGVVAMGTGVLAGAWVLWLMARSTRSAGRGRVPAIRG